MSDTIPSSARSALREAATWTADDTARLGSLASRIAEDPALWHHGVFMQRAYDKLTSLLSLAERGAEMIRVTSEEAAAASEFFSYGATRGNHRDDGLVGPGPLSGRVLAMNTLVNKLRDVAASSPTGGTTE